MNTGEPERAQSGEQLIGRIGRERRGTRNMVQLQIELGRPTEQTLQRAKHFDGPGTKPRSSADQTSVETSIVSVVIRMLLTEPGRPPRALFEIVPDVEMTVPFFVCSM